MKDYIRILTYRKESLHCVKEKNTLKKRIRHDFQFKNKYTK